MRLRDALDLCSEEHAHEWVDVPGGMDGRPATTFVAGIFDPGADEPLTRPLAGHSLAVYEPDARLSLVWPVPEDDEPNRRSRREDGLPEWAENDRQEWKSAHPGWAVILLCGAPIWQDLVWYLDWGSGIGGYVPHFSPVYGESAPGQAALEGWKTTKWAIGLVYLINSFSHTASEFYGFEPTSRLVPSPSPIHPVDEARRDY